MSNETLLKHWSFEIMAAHQDLQLDSEMRPRDRDDRDIRDGLGLKVGALGVRPSSWKKRNFETDKEKSYMSRITMNLWEEMYNVRLTLNYC